MGQPVSISCGVKCVFLLVCMRQLISARGNASIQLSLVLSNILFSLALRIPFNSSTNPSDSGIWPISVVIPFLTLFLVQTSHVARYSSTVALPLHVNKQTNILAYNFPYHFPPCAMVKTMRICLFWIPFGATLRVEVL